MASLEKPIDRPETMGQAHEWDKTKSRYLNDGACHRCASQAAWGHQVGFSLIHPPCRDCWGLTLSVTTLRRNGHRGQKWLLDPGTSTPSGGLGVG